MSTVRVALIPLRTRPRRLADNLAELTRRLDEVAAQGAAWALFPECTLTGYLYTEEDLARFAEPVSGPTARQLAALAQRYGLYLGVGFLERTPEGVYDSALLFDPQGHIALHARKVYEQPPFLRAAAPAVAVIGGRRVGVLICGDLFHEPAVEAVRAARPHLVWVPLARSFADRSPDPERWAREEREAYVRQAARLGAPVLLVNALEVGIPEPSFGGALVVSPAGEVLAEAPHGSDQALIVEVPV